MDASGRDDIDALERQGYIPILRQLVMSHATPIFWWDDAAPSGSSILHNGTVTFVDTGARVLAISAYHVFKQYRKDLAANLAIRCQIGSVTVEPEKYVYLERPNVDLVAFELPRVLQAATGAVVHSAASWPPEPLRDGDLVIAGGYPGNRRAELVSQVQIQLVSFVGRIYSTTERYGSMSLELGQSYWPQGEDVGRQPDLGGMSGGPVFRIVEKPVFRLEFAGVISEIHQSSEIILASHASLMSKQSA